jgi:hypothetical protein
LPLEKNYKNCPEEKIETINAMFFMSCHETWSV